MIIGVRYAVIFGKGDASDWISWDVELTAEEESAFKYEKSCSHGNSFLLRGLFYRPVVLGIMISCSRAGIFKSPISIAGIIDVLPKRR